MAVPPDEAGRWSKHVERPWQVEAVNLVGNMCGTPQRGVEGHFQLEKCVNQLLSHHHHF